MTNAVPHASQVCRTEEPMNVSEILSQCLRDTDEMAIALREITHRLFGTCPVELDNLSANFPDNLQFKADEVRRMTSTLRQIMWMLRDHL